MAPLLRRVLTLCALTSLFACTPPPDELPLPDAGPGPGNTSTVREPTPQGAAPAPVAKLGTPFDPAEAFYYGPAVVYSHGDPQIVAVPTSAGSIDVAWLDQSAPQIVLSHIVPDKDGYRISWHKKLETIDALAGFARDDDGNRYWVTTKAEDELGHEEEPSGLHRDGVARLYKMDPQGNILFTTEVRDDIQSSDALPLVAPMTAGTGRIAVGGGAVAITFSANTEYDPEVSQRHQYQAYYVYDANTGAGRRYFGSCSHSFDQRLIWDGARFVGMCLGDASLRGIGVTAISTHGDATTRVAFAIKGGTDGTGGAYQNTFTRLGALVRGGLGYGLLFSSENDPTWQGTDAVLAPRDLAFMHVRPDFEKAMPKDKYDVAIADTSDHNFRATGLEVEIIDHWGSAYTGRNHGLIWLTQFADTSQNVESPKLVALPSGHFLALWEEWSLSGYTGTYGLVIDEYGNVKTARTKLGELRLYRSDDAFALGDRAAWIVGEQQVPQLVLYTVDEALAVTRYELP